MDPYWKYCFKHWWNDLIWWEALKVNFWVFLISFIVLRWWGIILAVIFLNLMELQGGPVANMHLNQPPPPVYNNKCSAGMEDCKICNNEYNHEFNLKYNDKFYVSKNY